jgi:energy-coupling factor transport system ATP-binding protein
VRLNGWGWRHAGRRAWAVRGLDLDVAPGERVLLLGPSGSGKSTVLSAIAGLLAPGQSGEAEGRLLIDGRPAAEVRDRAGLVLQDPESGLVMSRAGDDVAFGLENRGVPADQIWPRVDEALAAVGFTAGRDADTSRCSGGEQQRLVAAGVLAMRPGVLLLDEVTANLDPQGAALVRAALAGVLDATGSTAVMVEHRMEAVVELVDRVVVLTAGGGAVADGPPSEVFGRYGAALAAAGVWVPGRPGPARRTPGRAPTRHRPDEGPSLLRARATGFRYPAAEAAALPPTDAALRAGRTLAVTGANGSGKSTLALLLAGLLRPSSGTVEVAPSLAPAAGGRPIWRWRAQQLVRAVGTVFQDPEHQFVTGSVRAELAFGPTRAGAKPADVQRRVSELLERLALTGLAEANPFTLSGGEKRRLSVATAIATAPAVVIADEPTFGQDARTWAELADLFAELRSNGTALGLVTHDLPLAEALADEVLTLPRDREGSPPKVEWYPSRSRRGAGP